MHQRGVRHLGVVVVAIVLALAAGGAEAHHGSQADCTGAGVCRPNGVFTITWSNSNPSACRFDVTVTWGDGSSSFVPDVRTGQSTSHTYSGHGLFTASTSAVVTGANCTFSAGSAVIEVPSPPAPPTPPAPPPPPPPPPQVTGGTGAAPAPTSGPRITAIEGAGTRVLVQSAAGQVSTARVGTGLRDGDRVHVVGTPEAKVEAITPGLDRFTLHPADDVICYEALIGDAVIRESNGHVSAYNGIPIQAFTTECGQTEVQSATVARQRSLHQAGPTGPGALALTPEAQAQISGRGRIIRDPRRGLTTVANLRGSVVVRPANPALGSLRLVPGQQVQVTRSSIGRPFDLVPNLENEIPSPRVVRAGPALVTAPSRLSLRSLRTSKCVRVAVSSSRPARVLVTIFSGRRSVRLFGQRLVRFAAPGRTTTCILVPRRARTFDVRTRLSFAVGYALGVRARPGERATRPVIRPITLVP